MNIVFLDAGTLSIGDIDFGPIEQLGNFLKYDRTSRNEIISMSKEADIIITNKVVIDQVVLNKLPNLKYICVAATGYNNIDLGAARAMGIPVSNVKGYSTTGVVQHVFALLMAILNKVEPYNKAVQAGRWQSSSDFTFYDHSISELSGKTFGIFGFGTIGASVAKVAVAFGMKVLATRRSYAENTEDITFVDKEDLFTKSDIISLHAPLNEETEGVVNSKLLTLMKRSAILINTARGPLVNEKDLATALKEGVIKAAGLDVLSQEPPTDGNPLIGIDNCIITPHQAWASIESRHRLLSGLVDNISSYQSGEILNRVG